jgi:predicted NBD/HSP70 family sugar kinase
MSTSGNSPGTPLARLLQTVHQRRAVSRMDLTRELGLSRTAVGQLLDELQSLGLVRLRSPDRLPGRPGRPSPVVEVDPEGPFVLAAQLHQSHLAVATVGLGGRILSVEAADVDHTEPNAVVRYLKRWAERAGSGRPVLGLGIAVSGLVRRDGFVHSLPYLGWDAYPLKARLAAAIRGDLPIEVANDANLTALGEYRHGAGAGATTFLCLLAEDVGVGGGLVVEGSLFTGSAGYGLEAGHLQVNPRGRLCNCGARGCLQVQCDSEGLLRAARHAPGCANPSVAAMQVLEKAARGDEAAGRAVAKVADWLAIGLTGLVNLVNPDRIALTGFHRELLRQQRGRLENHIRTEALVAQTSEVALVAGELDEPTLLGAAELSFEPLLRDPRSLRVSGGA